MSPAVARAVATDLVVGFVTLLVGLQLESHRSKLIAAVIGIVIGIAVLVITIILERKKSSPPTDPPSSALPPQATSSVLRAKRAGTVKADGVETDATIAFDVEEVGDAELKDIKQQQAQQVRSDGDDEEETNG